MLNYILLIVLLAGSYLQTASAPATPTGTQPVVQQDTDLGG